MAFINLNEFFPKSGGEGGQEGQSQLVLYSGGPTSLNGGQPCQEFENEAEGERVQYPGSSELPAASVLGMAQTVGATLSEDVAAALGDLAMKKLRAATLLAVGFADHENATGLRAWDFSKAEHALKLPSFGHRSGLPEPRVIPIIPANISILDEGPEVDLYSTTLSQQMPDFRVINRDPEFHVHHAVVNSKFCARNEEKDEDEEYADESSTPIVSNNCENNMNDHGIQNGLIQTLSPSTEEFLDEDSATNEDSSPSRSINQYLRLDHAWVEYMRLFVKCFVDGDSNGIQDQSANSEAITTDDEEGNFNLTESQDIDDESEFQYIIQDLVKYSALPIADEICKFFCDYLNGSVTPAVSSTALYRMILVVDAFMGGSATPPTTLMRKLSSILIEILVRPPGFQIQPTLVRVFMKILKNYDELLTWACTYITEVLKRTSEMTSEDISDEYKCLLHGALLLTNGLELLDIKVAHEFGWDSSIAGIKRTHYQAKLKENQGNNDNEAESIDTVLEEEFSKFEMFNKGS